MITIEPITQQEAMILKDVRLRALLDTPSAFSSTYEKESLLSDADWIDRAARWSGGRSITYLAKDHGVPCGILAAFLDQDDMALAHLVSMWVAPTHRRRGVGTALVLKIFAWARMHDVQCMKLLVTSNNDAAIRLYEQLGFAMTGNKTPHANDSSLGDCEMIRNID